MHSPPSRQYIYIHWIKKYALLISHRSHNDLISPKCRIYASMNGVSIGSDNGLLRGRRQAIVWTNAGMLLIGPLGINFNEIRFGILTFSFKKMYLKLPSVKMATILFSGRWVKNCSNICSQKCIDLSRAYQEHPFVSRKWMLLPVHS